MFIYFIVLAQDAIKAALIDYQKKNKRPADESVTAAVN
jgi:hypothetical protein